ncbi:TPA: hypothetical protein L6A81_12055 [Pseudomonas aeruginosa]|nr:hypothetical protein [Pseudomonas aeruginosa]
MRKIFGYLEELWRQVMPQKDGVSAGAEPTLAETFQAPVSELQVRASLLLRLALIFGGIAVTAGLVALVCYTVGWLHLPTGQVDKILLPQHAIDWFKPVQSSSKVSSGLGLEESLASSSEMVASLLTGTLFKVLGGIVFLVAIANAVVRLSVAPLLMTIPIIALPSMAKVIIGVDSSDSEARPAKNALVVAAKDNDYVTIKQLLNKESTIDDFTKAYILAQAAIAAHVNEPKVLQAATKDLRSDAWASLTRKLSNGKPSFTIAPETAYAIEKATDGVVLNPLASRFEDEALASVAAWRTGGWIAALVAVFFGVMATGPLSFSQVISSRLKRLSALFQQADPS